MTIKSVGLERPDGSMIKITSHCKMGHVVLGTALEASGIAEEDAKQLWVQAGSKSILIGWGEREESQWDCPRHATWEQFVEELKHAVQDKDAVNEDGGEGGREGGGGGGGANAEPVRLDIEDLELIAQQISRAESTAFDSNVEYCTGVDNAGQVFFEHGWGNGGTIRPTQLYKAGVPYGDVIKTAAALADVVGGLQTDSPLHVGQRVTLRRLQANKPVLEIMRDNRDLKFELIREWARFNHITGKTKKEYVDRVVAALKDLVRRRREVDKWLEEDQAKWMPGAKETLRKLRVDVEYFELRDPSNPILLRLRADVQRLEVTTGAKRPLDVSGGGDGEGQGPAKRAREEVREVIEVLDEPDVKSVVQAAVEATQKEDADPRDKVLARLAKFVSVAGSSSDTPPITTPAALDDENSE